MRCAPRKSKPPRQVGFTSEGLIKFGFRPQAVNRRKKPSVERLPPEQALGLAK